MVRDNRVSLGFDDDEIEKIKARAKAAHLKVPDYIRWYLFKPTETVIQSSPIQYQIPVSDTLIPYKAAPEVIERIKSGAPVYVDPYQQAKLEAQKNFKESGGLGQLHTQIRVMAKGGRVLKPIPKKEMKELEKEREKRKVYANKHFEEIKQKNIEAGILSNE